MQIFLRTLDANTITLEVDRDSTANDVQNAVYRKITDEMGKDLSGHSIMLVSSGKEIQGNAIPEWDKLETVHLTIMNKNTRKLTTIAKLPDLRLEGGEGPEEDSDDEGVPPVGVAGGGAAGRGGVAGGGGAYARSGDGAAKADLGVKKFTLKGSGKFDVDLSRVDPAETDRVIRRVWSGILEKWGKLQGDAVVVFKDKATGRTLEISEAVRRPDSVEIEIQMFDTQVPLDALASLG
jgi:hypothetical protein